VGDVRGRGLFAAIELVSDRQTRAGFENGAALPDELRTAAMAEGLVCYPEGILVDGAMVPHVMLAPPAIATEADLAEGVRRLSATLAAVLGPA
jgi:adenosylmethionine-8-amino-7-oxononanoate aminotransferase